jgi:NADH:ubiquinone oxidoreductase subunit F (NADH-binding)
VTTLAPTSPRSEHAPVGLLAAWHEHRRADLVAHLDAHGPLPLPDRPDPAWAASLVAELRASGLTGRGGGGFPTAHKLASVARVRGRPTVVVNATEGEPASDKDRVLLAVAPHLVLDGSQLVARLLGARRVVVCIAADRDESAARVGHALEERWAAARHAEVPTEIARPPARYVSGEESALVSWLDGGAAAPQFRPDKSVPLVIGRRPALVHNAETLAHVAMIARRGAGWFRSLGAPGAPGTTLVTVSGDVARPGFHEITLGTPIADVIARSEPVADVRAVLVGGYGGTWLGPEALGTPFAPEPLRRVGASVGAGVVVVVGTGRSALAESARIARYLAGESAGQCGPCVFGLPAIAADLEAIASGVATSEVHCRLRDRLAAVAGRGACRHPDGAVRMVTSALAEFGPGSEARRGAP